MKNRFKEISHAMLFSDTLLSNRVIELGNTCIEVNDILTKVSGAGVDEKTTDKLLADLAKKCVEVNILSDAISMELYLGGKITLKELDEEKEKIIKKL